MKLRAWLVDQWRDVRGNVKFALGMSLLTAGGAVVLRKVSALTHGLTTAQQQTLLTLFIVMFAAILAVAAWAILATKRADESDSKYLRILAPPPSLISVTPVALPERPHALADTDFNVEILEVLFRRQGGLFLGNSTWYLLLRVRLTNRGPVEPTVHDWQLHASIGRQFSRDGRIAEIPTSWYIERTTAGKPPAREEIGRPTLDELARNEEFRRGKSKTGWVLFEMYTQANAAAPLNAEFTLTIVDSMGSSHVGTLEPQLYIETGQIKSE